MNTTRHVVRSFSTAARWTSPRAGHGLLGAPLTDTLHSAHAVDCALKMRTAGPSDSSRTRAAPALRIGLRLHTVVAGVGDMGSPSPPRIPATRTRERRVAHRGAERTPDPGPGLRPPAMLR